MPRLDVAYGNHAGVLNIVRIGFAMFDAVLIYRIAALFAPSFIVVLAL